MAKARIDWMNQHPEEEERWLKVISENLGGIVVTRQDNTFFNLLFIKLKVVLIYY